MKLLWLSISEAHITNQAYKDEQYESMQGTTQAIYMIHMK